MTEYDKWDTVFLGKLKEQQSMKFNNVNDSIRFFIELIAPGPTNFPTEEEKSITGFSSDLENLGFINDVEFHNEEMAFENLKKFLDDYFLMFKVRKSKHPEYEKYYYNAYDIELVRKEEKIADRYTPIPFVRVPNGQIHMSLQNLTANDIFKRLEGFSKEASDYPDFLLIGQTSHQSLSGKNNIEKYFAIGPVNSMQYTQENGYQFSYDDSNELCYIEIDNDFFDELYISKENVVFVPCDSNNSVRQKIENDGLDVKSISNKPKIVINEAQFLNVFEEVSLKNGLYYDKIDLINFHTSMKTQGFVILAGMSGTGKSQIVQCYQEALNQFSAGMTSSTSNTAGCKLLFIPVRPFWQDDSDLLGYLDTLNGIYRPGDSGLVDFIMEAKDNPNECYIICLDEMNLARVEHYFSQFLSILERDLNKRKLTLYSNKLHGRIYNQHDYNAEITLGENLFFVGTVNLDESTFQFSDKVLDRANVINLSLQPFNLMRASLTNRNNVTTNTITQTDFVGTYDNLKLMKNSSPNQPLSEAELNFLWEIHQNLIAINEKVGVGYRIVNQIESYIMNTPNNTLLNRELALDLQITQRILTKIRGSERQLAELLGTFNEGEYEEGTLFKTLELFKELSEFKYAKNKILHLAREISEYGHTL